MLHYLCMKKKVTEETLKHIARLSKLEFSKEDLSRFAHEFESILDYIQMIEEVDVDGIQFKHNLESYVGDVLRDDKVRNEDDDIDKKKLMQNATNGREKNGYIRTSKIITD